MRGKTASMSSKVVSIGIPNAVQPTRMRSMDGVQVGRFRPVEVGCAGGGRRDQAANANSAGRLTPVK